ncbi:unnamed protein product [Pedinophyceae sp. YPF-701]|nr:unnamed protein product [Pedinophyceae sp. YPF-701]
MADIILSTSKFGQGEAIPLLVTLPPPAGPFERAQRALCRAARAPPVTLTAYRPAPPPGAPCPRCGRPVHSFRARTRRRGALELRCSQRRCSTELPRAVAAVTCLVDAVTRGLACWAAGLAGRAARAAVRSERVPLHAVDGAEDTWRGFLSSTPNDPPGAVRLEARRRLWPELAPARELVVLKERDYAEEEVWLRGEAGATAPAVPEPSSEEVAAMARVRSRNTSPRSWEGPAAAPMHVTAAAGVTARYGVRRRYCGGLPPGAGEYYFHEGLDLAALYGMAVRACYGGVVALVRPPERAFPVAGACVAIDHGEGVVSLYQHLSDVEVRVGQRVHSGDAVGRVGSTGRSSGPHVHWGVYCNGRAVNPLCWADGRGMSRWMARGARTWREEPPLAVEDASAEGAGRGSDAAAQERWRASLLGLGVDASGKVEGRTVLDWPMWLI